MASTRYIRWFEDIGIDDIPRVGGKSASLGEMYGTLCAQGIPVPNGFAITSDAWYAVLEKGNIWQPLRRLLESIHLDDTAELQTVAGQARSLIYKAGLPAELAREITSAYGKLRRQYGDELQVAVRSSATAEDLPSASFAGQHDSYLSIGNSEALLDACRRCFASVFTERAIIYRQHHGFDHFKVALAIAVMKMVRADRGASGVMFTLDTDSGFRDVVFISATWGLGENIVQGTVDPDEFYVHKPTFNNGARCVLRRHLGAKKLSMVSGSAGGGAANEVLNIETPMERQRRFALDDNDVLTLADYAIKTEAHYSQLHGRPCPMDIEWAKDGEDGKLYLVQARPETVVSQRPQNVLVHYRLSGDGEVLAQGRAIGDGIAVGNLRRIDQIEQLAEFRDGDILFTDSTSPDWLPGMRRAAGLVTLHGGRTCHAAIVSRELGIPAVVGIGQAGSLRDGQRVTVSCAGGDTGKIYRGEIPFETVVTELTTLKKTRTQMMINLGNPDQAFRYSALPCDGVGLARMEFIINQYVKAHPMALLYPDRISDADQRRQIDTLIENYPDGPAFFIEKLSEGVGAIAAAFYPRPVIVRTSDFKTNEYSGLVGGADFERHEENPMLGFRGAARYTHEAYAEGFALECAALKRARDDMGLHNIKVMIPFCRRVDEGRRVLEALEKYGLPRGEKDLAIYMMCEIPNNVIQIDAFAALFDGISIGSNDLTQLVLGVDRDSEIVAFDFDERDPGVLEMVRLAIEGAHRNGIPAGICGQAPSDYPEISEYLVKHGIDSISLSPDVLLRMIPRIAEIERVFNDTNSTGSQRI